MTEQELRAALSANIKRYRGYRKWSQAELAEKMDISIPFLSDIENGRKWISPATLVKCAGVLGIEPYELLKSPEAPPSDLEITLNKWSDDIIREITLAVNHIKNHYLDSPSNK